MERLVILTISLLSLFYTCRASTGSYTYFTPSGDLGDAQCNVEAVDQANSRQLHSILEELLATSYFRLFKVNLEGECPFWGKKQGSLISEGEDEGPSCQGPPNPDPSSLWGASPADPSPSPDPPACSLQDDHHHRIPDSSPAGSSFPWAPMSTPVDRTLSSEEGSLLQEASEEECRPEDQPTFWLDICDHIPTHEANHVNLQLNPERYTGYNGSHVWDAIYQENCFKHSQSLDGMCYEERVLYRLLSGMHASVNIHIALNYYPPRKGVRSEWEPNRQRFVDQFSRHPERLKNLYFSYVVVLRALRKAAPFLSEMVFRMSEEEEGEAEGLRTQALVKRLLDSHLLRDCAQVFEAFDETLMFSPMGLGGAEEQTGSQEGEPDMGDLKAQFKGVFHNISTVMNCISCQKCKLHGKLQLLGSGTALKVLLLPEDLLADSLAREELVALFNTAGKYSSAIAAVSELSQHLQAESKTQSSSSASSSSVSSATSDPAPAPSTSSSPTSPPPSTTSTPAPTSQSDRPRKKPQWFELKSGSARGSKEEGLAEGGGGSRQPRSPSTTLQQWGKLRKFISNLAAVPFSMFSSSPRVAAVQADPDVGRLSLTLGGGSVRAQEEVVDMMDRAIGATAQLAAAQGSSAISNQQEDTLIDATLGGEAGVLLLAKHYALSDPHKFARHALRHLANPPGWGGVSIKASGEFSKVESQAEDEDKTSGEEWDAVVIGGGLAGMSATLTLLDRGARVLVMEKEGFIGGNSLWASSGINAVDSALEDNPDSVKSFTEDTLKSGGLTHNPLVDVLTSGSVGTLEWLRDRVELPLEKNSQLGGHSHPRTHRPADGMAGIELIRALQKQTDKFMASGQLVLMKKTRAVQVLEEGGRVAGVKWERVGGSGEQGEARCSEVVIATGGYANDHTDTSLLAKHRPDLVKFATTNTAGTTGDGHKMALALGADTREMEHVQVHPTGFINPRDVGAATKTLCAELLRGAGALLLDRTGARFANELGTRDYISGEMIARDPEKLDFVILMNEAQAQVTDKHTPLYMKKGLLAKYDTLDDLRQWMGERGEVDVKTLEATLERYNKVAESGGPDEFGKEYFHNSFFNTSGPFYAGRVTPVVHYSMGGLAVDEEGRVLRAREGVPVPGLRAAGEVIGGLHGKNRLGGNALTECAVFGRLVGERIPLDKSSQSSTKVGGNGTPPSGAQAQASTGERRITAEELSRHASMEDCWVALFGSVYDFTDFLEEHPAGAQSILDYGGQDGSEIFEQVHSMGMLEDFKPIGILVK